jgi:hypothetical protein
VSIADSRYEAVASKPKYYWRQTSFLSKDSISYYGKNVGMEDPSSSVQNCSMISKLSQEQRKAMDKAIIKQTFNDVKKFSVGAQKPGNPAIKIKKVMNVEPFLEYIPNRITMAIFDHDVKENLLEAAKEQFDKSKTLNELLIIKRYGKVTGRSAALYSKTTNEPLVNLKEDGQIHLGNTEYELRREYDYFISTENQLKHNIILYPKDNTIRYMKPSAIFTMNKKKMVGETTSTDISRKVHIGARGYTEEEIDRNNKKYEEIGVTIHKQ